MRTRDFAAFDVGVIADPMFLSLAARCVDRSMLILSICRSDPATALSKLIAGELKASASSGATSSVIEALDLALDLAELCDRCLGNASLALAASVEVHAPPQDDDADEGLRLGVPLRDLLPGLAQDLAVKIADCLDRHSEHAHGGFFECLRTLASRAPALRPNVTNSVRMAQILRAALVSLLRTRGPTRLTGYTEWEWVDAVAGLMRECGSARKENRNPFSNDQQSEEAKHAVTRAAAVPGLSVRAAVQGDIATRSTLLECTFDIVEWLGTGCDELRADIELACRRRPDPEDGSTPATLLNRELWKQPAPSEAELRRRLSAVELTTADGTKTSRVSAYMLPDGSDPTPRILGLDAPSRLRGLQRVADRASAFCIRPEPTQKDPIETALSMALAEMRDRTTSGYVLLSEPRVEEAEAGVRECLYFANEAVCAGYDSQYSRGGGEYAMYCAARSIAAAAKFLDAPACRLAAEVSEALDPDGQWGHQGDLSGNVLGRSLADDLGQMGTLAQAPEDDEGTSGGSPLWPVGTDAQWDEIIQEFWAEYGSPVKRVRRRRKRELAQAQYARAKPAVGVTRLTEAPPRAIELAELGARMGSGARETWEELCTALIQRSHATAKRIRPDPGDGGVDVFDRDANTGAVSVWQCKYFAHGIGPSQQAQVRKSYARARDTQEGMTRWVLCVPVDLSLSEIGWWEHWCKVNRDGVSKEVWTGSEIRDILVRPENADLRREYFAEHNEAALRVSVVEFTTNDWVYKCRVRVWNDVALGRVAIFTRLFVDVPDCREHQYEMSKIAYRAPIETVVVSPSEKPFHFPPRRASWALLGEERKFPPNEVEDFIVHFKIEEGWQYLLRFGVTWYPIGSSEELKSMVPHTYLVGSPRGRYHHEDTYRPPPGFIDKPRALLGDDWAGLEAFESAKE